MGFGIHLLLWHKWAAVVSDRNFVEVKLVGKSTQFPC
jgi:hypothetical protein